MYFKGVFMKKITFYTELCYFLGIIILAFGTALMERADFGISMVVAPAYLLHLKISQLFDFFSFGMAEYTFQALILILIMLVQKKFKTAYLFSFVTAVLYGLALDGAISAVALLPIEHIAIRLVAYISGMVICAISISLFFHTYISPEAYELFVKELSEKFNISISKFKTAYDCASCILAIIMSFAFFGLWRFEGIKIGTVFCALLNGFLIGKASAILDKIFDFKDAFKLRKYFE